MLADTNEEMSGIKKKVNKTGHYLCGGGGKSWGGPGLFFLEKRGGPKENFTMIGGGSLCVL